MCARTDLEALNEQLEAGLEALHACGPEAMAAAAAVARLSAASGGGEGSPPAAGAPAVSGGGAGSPALAAFAGVPAFARVDEVVAGSPAATAGLQVGDALVCFDGDVRAAQGEGGATGWVLPSLVDFSARVRARVGAPCTLVVQRASSSGAGTPHLLQLSITPGTWPGGVGVLGTRITPLSAPTSQ